MNGNVACPTLRSAVGRADGQNNHPTIYLQAGTFQLMPGNGGQLDLATSMDIIGAGPGGAAGTIIQQTDNQNRVLEVDGTTTLSGLEITGGHWAPSYATGTASGGGILVVGTLDLQDSLVTGNQAIGATGTTAGDNGNAALGGGIAYVASALSGSTITDSTISANAALGGAGASGGSNGGGADGGGISYKAVGPLIVQSSTLSANTSTGGDGGGGPVSGGSGGLAEGGGVFNGSDLTLDDSTLTANSVTGGAQGPGSATSTSTGGNGRGGGIESVGAGDTVVNSTVVGNAAQGGGASSPSKVGSGVGGGLEKTGSRGLLLASDTFDANRADTAASIFADVPSPPTGFGIHDTVLAAASSSSASNCEFFPSGHPVTDESYNLEDDGAATCGFSQSNHDLVGADPQLPSALGNYGGPTQTLAPSPASALLGTGGQCLDPSSTPANQPLTVDQRGEPRANPCDIGAFEAQRPSNTISPAVSGRLAQGRTLICSQGTWTGDGSLTFGYAWLRNGVLIPGTSTNTYVVGAADRGQSLACRVTATYYGSKAIASPFLIVQSYPLITLLKVSSTPDAVTVSLGCRGPDGLRCRGEMTLSVIEKRRGGRTVGVLTSRAGKRTAMVGQQGYSLRTRHVARIRIALRPNLRRLIRRFGKVPALLTVTQTTAMGTQLVASHHVKIHPAKHARRG